ncbi:MAG TPA: hydratase [Cyanothece sp. UBA12306]|nr:hydratase [Cyanothece sp. UBA12306]
MKINYLLFLVLLLLTPVSVVAQTKNIDQSIDLDIKFKHNNNSVYLKRRYLINQQKNIKDLSSQQLDKVAKIIENHYLNKKNIADLPTQFTLQESIKIQNIFLRLLMLKSGKIIGYKAGLTNKKIQTRFNTNQPVLGSLLEKMLLPSGTTISPEFGAIPMLEGDLIVRVKNEDINQAKTAEEVLQSLDTVIPFLELPDLMYAKNVQLNKEMLIAINVGARLGIIGQAIALEATKEWYNRLNNIQVIITDQSGQKLAKGNSKALLGDPLKVVLWIKNQLQSQGKSLQKGDLLSLGSITPLIPVKAGQTISANYIGLNKNSQIQISVHFDD